MTEQTAAEQAPPGMLFYEFHGVVQKVEQREEKWWVTLDGWGAALCFGRLKPDCRPGDEIIMDFRRSSHGEGGR